MNTAPTEHWKGPEGTDYAARSPGNVQASRNMFYRIFDHLPRPPESVIEFGAGVGTNLQAIGELGNRIHRTGVEVNADAAKQLARHCESMMISSLESIGPLPPAEMTFTRGVLIHLPEPALQHAFDLLFKSSSRWVMVAEYYSPNRTMVPYRGKPDLLWTDDYVGKIIKQHPSLRLIDYGFVSKYDDMYPQDDVTWFMMEKT